jgi:biopolymer transport protein ExbD
MAFKPHTSGSGSLPQPEINMVPLIDVMLVLLIIFMVTAPLLVHAVKVELPRASSQPLTTTPQTVVLTLDSTLQLHWDLDRLERGALAARLQPLAAEQPQPEVHIRADGAVPYREVAALMSEVAAAGLTRIGFVTAPLPATPTQASRAR